MDCCRVARRPTVGPLGANAVYCRADHLTKVGGGSAMSLNATDAGSRASPPATPNPLDEEDQADVNQECWSPGQRRRPEDMSPFER